MATQKDWHETTLANLRVIGTNNDSQNNKGKEKLPYLRSDVNCYEKSC
jgi:hypothetical protein